jgi:hypothetical protein
VENMRLSGGFFGHFHALAAVVGVLLHYCSVVISWGQP